jgi:CheY-like chemotaxis protein
MRVLVADRSRVTADLFVYLLATWGHHAEAAYDGLEALEKALALRPDVALLDLDLPGLSAAEVARRLRAESDGTWVVALTSLGAAGPPAADAATFHWRLYKPVEPSHLLELLKAAEAAAKGAG